MTAGAAFALVALPLAYFAAFVLMFIEVNTIYHLSKHRASAGGYYSYVSAGLGARPAIVSAVMVVFYQAMSVAGVTVYIGGVLHPPRPPGRRGGGCPAQGCHRWSTCWWGLTSGRGGKYANTAADGTRQPTESWFSFPVVGF
jgi:amino acid transporter